MRTTRSERSERTHQSLPRLALLVASVFLAGTATAEQVYQMTTGVWGRGDGLDADVPFIGKTLNNCSFLVQGQNKLRTMNDTMGTPTTHTGFMVEMALPFGCPSGMGQIITATAPGTGAAFTLPPHVFTRPALGYLVAVPLPGNPNLIQAATSGLWRIPHSTRGTGADALGAMTTMGLNDIGPNYRQPMGCVEATCTNLAPFRLLHKSAWRGGPMTPTATFNSQTGRVGADFTWHWQCFGDNAGGGGSGCTTLGQGALPLILRYKAGPNRFGGTMNQIVNTGIVGSLAINLGFQVLFNLLDAGMGAIQVEGRGYADFLTDVLPAAMTAYSMVMVAPVMPKALGYKTVSLITAVTNPVPPAPLFAAPQLNEKYGFPLTTGTVIVRRVSTVATPVVTITAKGYDCVNAKVNANRTACSTVPTGMGARNISLVTGSLSHLSTLGSRTVGMSQMFMSLPEPSRTGQLLAGVLALVGMAAWRSRRLRSSAAIRS
jgi:hypothetical protein